MGGKHRYLSIMMLLTGVVFPALVLTGWGRRMAANFYFPVAPTHFCLLFLGTYLYGNYDDIFGAVEGITLPNTFNEVREFLFSVAMLSFAVQGLRNSDDVIFRRTE